MNKELFERQSAKIVDRALSDEKFKDKLLADPVGVYKEYDVDIPEGVNIKVVQNAKDLIHLVLPHEKPQPPERKHWIGEMFEDIWRLTFADGKHEKTWAEMQDEDVKIFHSGGKKKE